MRLTSGGKGAAGFSEGEPVRGSRCQISDDEGRLDVLITLDALSHQPGPFLHQYFCRVMNEVVRSFIRVARLKESPAARAHLLPPILMGKCINELTVRGTAVGGHYYHPAQVLMLFICTRFLE